MAAAQSLSRWRRDGSVDIVVGSLVAGLAAYAYEVAGGRVLGPHAFAPISALLTIHFLAFVVILLPLEQVVIRRLTIDARRPGVPVGAVGVIAAAALGGAVLAWIGRGPLFQGDGAYAALVAATVVAHGLFAVGRGHLAGRARYRSYGMTSAAAALVRLAVAGFVLAVNPSSLGFAAALVVGPLVVLAWRPFREGVDGGRRSQRPHVVDVLSAESHLLAGLMLASAASQALLLSGPVVVALLGARPAVVSAVFVTFTLFRAPLTLGYNLVARVLPPLTAAAVAGDSARLVSWGRRIGAGAVVLSGAAAMGAAWIGPAFVSAVFGDAFRPDAELAGLVAGGVMLAGGALFAGQIHVARGDAGRLADAWLFAIVATGAGLIVPVGDAATRVGLAFVLGEGAALAALVLAMRNAAPGRSAVLGRRRRLSTPWPSGSSTSPSVEPLLWRPFRSASCSPSPFGGTAWARRCSGKSASGGKASRSPCGNSARCRPKQTPECSPVTWTRSRKQPRVAGRNNLTWRSTTTLGSPGSAASCAAGRSTSCPMCGTSSAATCRWWAPASHRRRGGPGRPSGGPRGGQRPAVGRPGNHRPGAGAGA